MSKNKQFSDKNKSLGVGAVAQRSGLTISAIHFYESKGLIKSWRNPGNQRRFPKEVLRRLAIIKVAQELGISLAEIKKTFNALPKQRTPTTDDWQKLSQKWQNTLDDRIRRLSLLRNNLTDCIGCGCLSVKSCPLRNTNDKLSKKGSGPILLE